MEKNLFTTVTENAAYVLSAIGIAIAAVLIAYLIEKLMKKKNHDTERILTVRKIALIGVFSAIGAIVMLFELPMPFAPSFYEFDIGDLPVLLGSFAFGPVAGVMIEFLRLLLKIFMKGTSTAFIGDLANFVIGCSFFLPAAIIYHYKKSKKSAIIGCIVGTIARAVFGAAFNAIYLLPAFAQFYGMPLEALIEMGTKINPMITNTTNFVILTVAPVNLVKGGAVSLITLLIYKKLSPIIKK